MPERHGQTPARCLPLPESEPLWRAGRGCVVRELPWTVEKLRVIPPFEYENLAVIALSGIPNQVQTGDMGVGWSHLPRLLPRRAAQAAARRTVAADVRRL
jgi:hypothetical protein